MGRSRGGLTSEIHALMDAEGRPAALNIMIGEMTVGEGQPAWSAEPGPDRPSKSPMGARRTSPHREFVCRVSSPGDATRDRKRMVPPEGDLRLRRSHSC